MVSVQHDLDTRDRTMLRRLVENHVAHTGSDRGEYVLEHWDEELDNVVKVMPDAYARVLEEGAEDVREQLPAGATPDADASAEFAASDD